MHARYANQPSFPMKNSAMRSYLFNWEKIENNDKKLKEHLKKKFGIEWTETRIERIDDNNIKLFFSDMNCFLLSLNDKRTMVRATLTDDGRTDDFIAKMENGDLNVYKKPDKPMDSFPKM